MTATTEIPTRSLYELVTGYYVSQALNAVARLGVADRLADAALGADELAELCAVHGPSLRRVLRLLVAHGLFHEDDAGRFSLTDAGQPLRAGVPGSMRAMVLLFGGITQRGWMQLPYTLETGKPGFEKEFGLGTFEYFAAHPDESANFDAAMADFTRFVAQGVAATYDFRADERVVDVGGGNGALLGGVLQRHPALSGLLFDLPTVVAGARANLQQLGVAGRVEVCGGDFFESVPAGGDVYLLKHVLHDWDDDRARRILENCRAAMNETARLVIVEGLYPARVDRSELSRGAAANDVNMLVSTGGRQRSKQEFEALYAAAGLRLTRILDTPLPVKLIEGERA